ncbi:interleukin-27 subunit alpha [Mugil cephalus]|uniref:interleukin-27 subunit alpha n=1 Tax=Mugil cephalus TaxID=48193 RepID=UPI001FB7959F|nr:interleukin-27 subunit alpha [Mugil cephalus]
MAIWWWALILPCCMLNCVESSAASSVLQRNKYNHAFRHTRSTKTRVQQLLRKYKQEQLGSESFEDRSRQLKDMPLLSTDFYSWLNLTDWDRLQAALKDMQTYWNMLEGKRKQLEGEKEQMVAQTTLSQSIRDIQLDLRDLMRHVSSQMSFAGRSHKPVSFSPSSHEGGSKTTWDSRVEGYVILRDLDLFLIKLARDFLLMASKTHS